MKTVERKITQLVPVYLPADSAELQTYFECDSLNNVLLKQLAENKSDRMSSEFDFKDGKLNYKAKAQPDTVYLPSDSVFIEREIPYPVEIDKIIYQQTKLQRIFYMIGIIATTAGAVWLIIRFRFNKTF